MFTGAMKIKVVSVEGIGVGGSTPSAWSGLVWGEVSMFYGGRVNVVRAGFWFPAFMAKRWKFVEKAAGGYLTIIVNGFIDPSVFRDDPEVAQHPQFIVSDVG